MITPEEKENLLKLHIDQKAEKSKSIIREAIEKFGVDKIAPAITGGKDTQPICGYSGRHVQKWELKYRCACLSMKEMYLMK